MLSPTPHPNSLRARFPDHSHELRPKGNSRGNLPGHTQPTALTAAAYSLAYIQRLPPGASAPPPTSNDSIATNQLPPTSVAILARAIPLTTRAHHPYSPSAKERLFFRVGGRAHSLSRIIALAAARLRSQQHCKQNEGRRQRTLLLRAEKRQQLAPNRGRARRKWRDGDCFARKQGTGCVT